MQKFENLFLEYMNEVCEDHPDPSHDILHVQRVVALAKKLAKIEGANLEVVLPAAYLHDCVYVSKADARRSQASRLSAQRAIELLRHWQYPERHFDEIAHAIESHSFSAAVSPQTIEAKVVQDADRLDAMGAVGVFRCFAFSGLARRPLYFTDDPFCKERVPDDSTNTLDHFFVKLLRLQDKLNTPAAKLLGERRVVLMQTFLAQLESEVLDVEVDS